MAESTDEFKIRAVFEAVVSKFEKQIDVALKKIEQFDQVAKQLDNVKLDADDKGLIEKVEKSKESLKYFDSKAFTPTLNLKDKLFVDKFNKAKTDLGIIDKIEANPAIDVADSVANGKIQHVERALDFLNNKRVNTFLNLDNKLMLTRLATTKARLEKLDHSKVNVNLEVDSAKAKAEVSTFKAILRSIPNKIKSKIVVEADNKKTNVFAKGLESLNKKVDVYNEKMDKLAKSIRTFGTVAQNFVQGIAIQAFSGLIPIVASAIPVVMALGNAIGVLGGGALGAAGAFGIAGAGLIGFGAMAKTATSMLKDGLIQASEATKHYQSSIENLKTTWQGIVSMNADHIFNAMGTAVDGVSNSLKALTPFLSGVASLVEFNAEKFNNWVTTSSTAQKMFEMLNTTGVSVFGDLTNAVGRFGDGFINIFTQFAPLFKWVSQGIQNMSIEFQKWANSVGTSQGIQQFIKYVETNLPIIGKIFGDIFMGIINLFKAFGQNSQGLFQSLSELTGKFREWSESVGKSDGFKKLIQYIQDNGPTVVDLIGNVVTAVINFATAMAPIGSVVLKVVTAFAGFVSKLFETHPNIARIVGVLIMLSGAFMSFVPILVSVSSLFGGFGNMFTVLGNVIRFLLKPLGLIQKAFQLLAPLFAGISAPVLIVIGVITALVAIFIWLWNTNEGFRNGVIAIWNSIKSFISTTIKVIVSVIRTIWGAIVSWWNEHQESIRTAVVTIWNAIKTAITVAINVVRTIITTVATAIATAWSAIWNGIVTVVTTVWNIIKTIVMTAIQVVITIILVILGVLVTIWQAEWNAIVTVVKFIWSIIGDTVMAAINFVLNIITTVINIIVTVWTTIWNVIVTVVSFVWNLIVTAVSTYINFVLNIISTVINTVLSIWSAIWNTILAVGSAIWNAIVSVVTTVMNTMKNTLSAIWNAIVTAVRVAWEWVRSTIIDKIRAAWQTVSSTVQAIWNAVSNAFNNVVNTVRNAMSNFFNSIKEKVQAAYNAVVNFVSQFRDAGANLIQGLVDGVVNAAHKLIDAVGDAVQGAIDWAKNLLDMHSPSRVFRQIGEYTMEGMEIGIKGRGGRVIDQISDVAQGVIKAFNPVLNIPEFNDLNGLTNLNSSFMTDVAHHHSFEQKSNLKTVRIELAIDNEAISAIVNDQNSVNDAIYEF